MADTNRNGSDDILDSTPQDDQIGSRPAGPPRRAAGGAPDSNTITFLDVESLEVGVAFPGLVFF